jgi:ABC-type multidrug transport system ATPase subunit
MIEARGLVKRYGSTAAVNDLTFTIRPGLVTGFLGPNGVAILGQHARRRAAVRLG